MVKLLIVGFALLAVVCAKDKHAGKSTLTLVADKKSAGTLFFDSKNGATVITGTITGLTKNTEHGLIIHDVGTFKDNDCSKIGDHFNPNKKNHGGLTGSDRHMGDLENIKADENGKVEVSITVSDSTQLPLKGANSIIGKVIAIHTNKDDLGTGTGADADESKKTGNVGEPLACGLVQKGSAGCVIPTMFTFVALILAKLL